MQWLLTRKVWLLNTRKVHLAHFLKKSGYSPFQLQYHIFYFIVQYVGTLLEGSMIRELCLQRDNDDFTLSKSELSILIDNLCDLAVTYVTLENGLIIMKCSYYL